MSDERKIDALLKSFGQTRVAITHNKKASAAGNFRAVEGKRSAFKDGFWQTRPAEEHDVAWGVHFQQGRGETPSQLWAGRWMAPEESNGKWIFNLASVRGPLTTNRTFKELFGVAPQATFVYFRQDGADIRSTSQVTSHLEKLQQALSKLPVGGEDVSAMAKRRLGHGALKDAVHQLFANRCCVTEIKTASLLVCSHIKPWSKSTGVEKVSPDNTLLLAANWDAVFDRGLVGFSDRGRVVKSPALSPKEAKKLGIDLTLKLSPETLKTRRLFLKYHRENRMLDKSGKRGGD